MSELLNKLVELVGDEEKAKAIQSSLGEYMIPKTEYAKLRDANKQKDIELEQLKLSSMDSSQKLEHELAKAQAIQKEFGTKTSRLEAEKLFVEAGIASDLYNDILDKSVSEDKEKTMSLVNGFINIISKEKENAINKTKEQIVNSTPKPVTGDQIKDAKQEPIKLKTTF